MKYITFAVLIAFNTIPLDAQVVLSESDIASIGDSYILTNANPLILFDGDDTGADHNWNFNTLTPVMTDTSRWIDVEDTDPFYFFLWLSSDIAEQTTSDITNDYFTIEDVFNFYAKDAASFEMSGFAGTFAGVPLPVSFDDNDVVYEFPLEFGDSYSSVSNFNIEIPGLGSWSEQRSRTNTIDGWGNVTTPYGDFNSLRIKSVSEIIDTFVYEAIVVPFNYTITEYKWLTPDGGIPVLQINLQDVLGTETITQVMYRGEQISSEIKTPGLSGDLQLINTLAGDELKLQVNNPLQNYMTAEIISTNGESNSEIVNLSGGINSINIEELPEGFYLLVIRSNGNIIATQKFVHEN